VFLLPVHFEIRLEFCSHDVQPTSKFFVRVLHNHAIRKDEILGGFECSIADLLKLQNTGDSSKCHILIVVLRSDLQYFSDITIALQPLGGKGNLSSRGSITLHVQDGFESSGKSYMPTEGEISSAMTPPKVVAMVDTVNEDVSRASELIADAKGGLADSLVKKLDPVASLLDELSKVRSPSFSLLCEQCF